MKRKKSERRSKREWKLLITAFIFSLLQISGLMINIAFAVEQTNTGFYYPTGTSQLGNTCGIWLG